MKVRLGPCKGKDFAATLGPWIVTADELEGFHDADGFLELELQVLVNGELIGSDLLSNMGWSFPQLLVYASRNSRVVPGDVLRAPARRLAAAPSPVSTYAARR